MMTDDDGWGREVVFRTLIASSNSKGHYVTFQWSCICCRTKESITYMSKGISKHAIIFTNNIVRFIGTVRGAHIWVNTESHSKGGADLNDDVIAGGGQWWRWWNKVGGGKKSHIFEDVICERSLYKNMPTWTIHWNNSRGTRFTRGVKFYPWSLGGKVFFPT